MRALLVDVSGLFWAAYHAGADREIGFAYGSTIEQVARWASHYRYVGVCLDTPPYKRKAISAAYKANRDAPEPAAIEQFRRTKERLAADYHMFAAPGFEADDILAALVSQWQLNGGDGLDGVDILSGDKDLLQLCTERVCVVRPRDGKRFGIDETIETFGVHPTMMRDLLALMGDSADNVPGVKGVGAKKAAKLLMEHGDLEGVCEAAKKGRLTPALASALIEAATPGPDGVTPLEMSARLVALMTDAPVEWATILIEKIPARLTADSTDNYDDDGDDMTGDYYEDESENDSPDDDVVASIGQPVNRPPAVAPEAAKATDAEFDSAPRQTPAPASAPAPVAQTQAIVRAELVPTELNRWALEPTSPSSVMKLSAALFESRLFPRFPNQQSIMAVIIHGRELGLGAMTALSCSHGLVEGKHTWQAHFIASRIMEHPDCEYLQYLGGDDTYAEYETKHRKHKKETKLKYTIDQARKAGLVRPNSNWDKRPAEMLRKTCALHIGRICFPSATMGLLSAEEMGGDERAA